MRLGGRLVSEFTPEMAKSVQTHLIEDFALLDAERAKLFVITDRERLNTILFAIPRHTVLEGVEDPIGTSAYRSENIISKDELHEGLCPLTMAGQVVIHGSPPTHLWYHGYNKLSTSSLIAVFCWLKIMS
jgi:hypothetical protein